MQKLAGSIPRQSRCARFAGCGDVPPAVVFVAASVRVDTSSGGVVATRFVCAASGKSATAKAPAHKSASGCAARARRGLLVCDCSSLAPLTLKPRRSPSLCLFVAIATALLSGLRRTRGSATNSHRYGGFGAWLQRH